MFFFIVSLVEANNWSKWSSWSQCSRSCDAGTEMRTRQANFLIIQKETIQTTIFQCLSTPCLENSIETRTCKLCGWSEWTEWSNCPVSCLHKNEKVKQSRKRFCQEGNSTFPEPFSTLIESDQCDQVNAVQFGLELCDVPAW